MRSTGRTAAGEHHGEAKLQCQICLGVTQLKLISDLCVPEGRNFIAQLLIIIGWLGLEGTGKIIWFKRSHFFLSVSVTFRLHCRRRKALNF